MAAGASLIFCRRIMTIRPHVPLIKFRKGDQDGTHNNSSRAAPSPASSQGPMKAKSTSTGSVIEDFQLPFKYRRLPIDDKEIEAINSGGVL